MRSQHPLPFQMEEEFLVDQLRVQFPLKSLNWNTRCANLLKVCKGFESLSGFRTSGIRVRTAVFAVVVILAVPTFSALTLDAQTKAGNHTAVSGRKITHWYINSRLFGNSAQKPPSTSNRDFSADAVREEMLDGRRVTRFEHDSLKEWRYLDKKRHNFYVVQPKKRGGQPPPLLVILHSAGGNAESELKTVYIKTPLESLPTFYALSLNCEHDSEWWWGADAIRENKERYRQTLTPIENRVLATIEWVVRKYHIDRNRVYLRGISMGGSGALGLGMPRGDIFAAIYVGVPAGFDHFIYRMYLADGPLLNDPFGVRRTYHQRASGFGLPDSPPLIIFHSQKDVLSKGLEQFLQIMHDGRHSMVFGWGPWGHVAKYDLSNPAALEFPWLAIRKNEAYPVFTNASSDDHYPGLGSSERDQQGQMNAYFRWTVLKDTQNLLAMGLKLVSNSELPNPFPVPKDSTVDVTLRRLQKFSVKEDMSYEWHFVRTGRLIASGKVRPDPDGLLTIPRVMITGTPAQLTLRPYHRQENSARYQRDSSAMARSSGR